MPCEACTAEHTTYLCAGTGLWWAIVLACVSAFQALSINAYFFRLFRITCQLKVQLADTVADSLSGCFADYEPVQTSISKS